MFEASCCLAACLSQFLRCFQDEIPLWYIGSISAEIHCLHCLFFLVFFLFFRAITEKEQAFLVSHSASVDTGSQIIIETNVCSDFLFSSCNILFPHSFCNLPELEFSEVQY